MLNAARNPETTKNERITGSESIPSFEIANGNAALGLIVINDVRLSEKPMAT
jgi:hypothetical protein